MRSGSMTSRSKNLNIEPGNQTKVDFLLTPKAKKKKPPGKETNPFELAPKPKVLKTNESKFSQSPNSAKKKTRGSSCSGLKVDTSLNNSTSPHTSKSKKPSKTSRKASTDHPKKAPHQKLKLKSKEKTSNPATPVHPLKFILKKKSSTKALISKKPTEKSHKKSNSASALSVYQKSLINQDHQTDPVPQPKHRRMPTSIGNLAPGTFISSTLGKLVPGKILSPEEISSKMNRLTLNF